MDRLTGTTVIVTGGTMGIGEAIVRRCIAENGCAVVVARNAERGAAVELAPHNIRVNAVAPGLTATPLFEAWIAEHDDPAAFAADVAKTIPQGRFGTPEEVAYLAADESAHGTGASIPVDGGYTAA